MKPVIFSNEDGTQKVTFTISKSEGDDININVEFEPKLGDQDMDSLHMVMSDAFMTALQKL